MHAIFVTVKVKPERLDTFLEVIENDAICSPRDEPGCIRFEVFQNRADAHTYHFFEMYRDEEALQAHRETPHFAKWQEASGEVLQEPPTREVLKDVFPRA
ncbi:MAG TPA: putative quinol monooxygenase [Candidatus Dormibacteraeota bacterium]|jgi:autoinducer 2-degrading protein|nr:putative quinol monooxygenase [Candidatus Dormibacteraeota bacterium]